MKSTPVDSHEFASGTIEEVQTENDDTQSQDDDDPIVVHEPEEISAGLNEPIPTKQPRQS